MTDDTKNSDDATPAEDAVVADDATAKAEPAVDAAAAPSTDDAATDWTAAVPEAEAASAAKPVAKAKKPAADAATPEQKAKEQKAAKREARESFPVRAVAKYLRFSAQKGRLVVDPIRGMTVAEAATVLHFSKKAAALEVMKVLKSAAANAENNFQMNVEDLYVAFAYVDEGPTFKRWKPRARGRVDRINKRTCHVTVIVDNMPSTMLEGRRGNVKKSSRAARVAASTAKPLSAGDRSKRVASSKAKATAKESK